MAAKQYLTNNKSVYDGQINSQLNSLCSEDLGAQKSQ